MKLFLDTNVLIDFLLERAPFYEAAAMIISYAAEKRISVSVSAISVVNLLPVRRLRHEVVRRCRSGKDQRDNGR